MPEINRLDKIARRSKRVGGAIADLWGSHLVGTYYVEKLSLTEKKQSRVTMEALQLSFSSAKLTYMSKKKLEKAINKTMSLFVWQ